MPAEFGKKSKINLFRGTGRRDRECLFSHLDLTNMSGANSLYVNEKGPDL